MAKRAASVAHAEYEILRELMRNIDLEDLMDEMVVGRNADEIRHAQKRWDDASTNLLKWMKKRADVRAKAVPKR